MDPLNIADVQTVDLTSTATPDAEWVGGFFAYGGKDADASVIITFAIPPGKRLGKHVDTAEETQLFWSGSGELLRDSGNTPVKKGDVVVLKIGEAHDVRNTGDEDLVIIGFFSGPTVEQHWDVETWPPDDSRVTGPPNRG
jgi:mannose-6-phosphate isomerase-like protein (cupin superfamily)